MWTEYLGNMRDIQQNTQWGGGGGELQQFKGEWRWSVHRTDLWLATSEAKIMSA
jgi:hypothetical protein